MFNLSSHVLLAVFSVVCALLVLKAQVLGAATAATRGKLKKFINPEDAAWLGGEHVNPDDERVQRLFRAHRNDLENLLPFFAGGALYILSGATATAGVTYFVVFLLARYAHTFAYLKRKARLRRDAFTVGWLITIVLSLHAAWVALAKVAA
jgi:prostaglandin-E synthase 1